MGDCKCCNQAERCDRQIADDITALCGARSTEKSRRIPRQIVACICGRIRRRLFVTLTRGTVAQPQSRSRDVSDPRTDPGAKVRGPEVGSLTSRLLSAALSAAAKPAATPSIDPRGSLSANSRAVFGYAHGPRSASPHDRSDAGTGTSPQEGGDGRPGAISPSSSPLSLCQVPREARRLTVRDRGSTRSVG